MPIFALVEPEHSYSAALPSTLLHGLLIAGAVIATRAVAVVTAHGPQDVVLEWHISAPSRATVSEGGFRLPGAPVLTPPADPTIPVVGDLPTIPGLPVVDPRSLVAGNDSLAWSQTGGDPPRGTEVFSESEVDEGPSLIAAGPLRYPAVLREAGITGSVTLTFVIDVQGRVEGQGLEVLSATHPGFIASASEVIRASRFTPARRHGKAVRVMVRQTVVFRS